MTTQDNFRKSSSIPNGGSPKVTLHSISASWVSSDDAKSAPTLSNITCSLSGDKVVVIVGPCGSGKSSFLHVLLNEIPIMSDGGIANIQGAMSYASQESWIFGGTVKQNIVFGRPFDPEKYRHCVEAAALLDDFKQLPYGENTMVGERGVSLSGGQKARVSLARCLYQKADIYVMDDILSAVDTKVSRHLFEKCIKSYLKGKLRILVTHQLQYLPQADHVIVLKEGQILAQGTYEQLVEAQIDFVSLMTSVEDDAKSNRSISRKGSILTQQSLEAVEPSRPVTTQQVTLDQEQKVTVEMKATGSVGYRVYLNYFKMGRSPCLLIFSILIFVVCQVSITSSSYFLSFWTNAENNRMNDDLTDDDNYLGRDTYIYVYSGIMAVIVITSFLRGILFFTYSTKIGINLHNSMFFSLIRAPIRFFDENPSGRIMNRFTKDMGSMDELLAATLFDMLIVLADMAGVIVVIIISNYYMAPPAIIVLLMLWWIRRFYVATARDVKRIEGISKQVFMSHHEYILQFFIVKLT